VPKYAPNAEPQPDCWNWGRPALPAGYGLIYINGRTRGAHRWIYEQIVGPVPEGLELDHKCRNRNCVNYEHLEPVTHQQNILRGMDAVLKARYTRKAVPNA